MRKTHKGATRRYWCPHALDEDGKVKKETLASGGWSIGGHVGMIQALLASPEPATAGCCTGLLMEGDVIPNCAHHGLPMKKARFKRAEERQLEARENAKLQIGDTFYWSDVAVRKAKCHLCMGQIEGGERRIAIDSRPRYQPNPHRDGGVITRNRSYVHASCFIDMIFGGEAGEGCPGCSAKILHDEFMQVRGLLEREYGA